MRVLLDHSVPAPLRHHCWNDHVSRIFSLYSSDVPDVSRESIAQAAKNVVLANGLTTLDSPRGESVSNGFRERKNQYALAQLGGNKIWWRPGRYEGSVANWIMGAVLHEVLHNVGFDDAQLQTGLLLQLDGTYTDNISVALALNCFR